MPVSKSAAAKGGAVAALVAFVGTVVAHLLVGDIRTDEGRRYHAYHDVGKIVSICDGDTHGVVMGQTATDVECDDRTAKQLLTHAQIVIGCAPALREVGREQQLRAFTRMDYNTGAFCKGWFENRPAPAAFIRGGNWRGGCDEILHYDLIKGKPIRGLTRRRHREREVCVTGLLPDATIQNLPARIAKWR